MYQSPDLKRVAVNVKDVFASYGCPMDEYTMWNYTDPCEGTGDYRLETMTLIDFGWGDGCYTTQTPN